MSISYYLKDDNHYLFLQSCTLLGGQWFADWDISSRIRSISAHTQHKVIMLKEKSCQTQPSIYLGNPAIYGSFENVPWNCRPRQLYGQIFVWVELRTSAVLWNLFNAKKTARPRHFYGHFLNGVDQNHKNCEPLQYYGHFSIAIINLHP